MVNPKLKDPLTPLTKKKRALGEVHSESKKLEKPFEPTERKSERKVV